MLKLLVYFCLFTFSSLEKYPTEWWKTIDPQVKHDWEILPSEATSGEVILSKRTALGVFSNLAFSPFTLDGIKYASIEALWQALKYPDQKLDQDKRKNFFYPKTREEIYNLHGFECKEMGDVANNMMRTHSIAYVSYQGYAFNYKDKAEGSRLHYDLIFRAMKEKVYQNAAIKKLLIQTKGLTLRADHHIKQGSPDSYNYPSMLMKIRESL